MSYKERFEKIYHNINFLEEEETARRRGREEEKEGRIHEETQISVPEKGSPRRKFTIVSRLFRYL